MKRALNRYNVAYFMPVQTGYGSTALDFIVCVNGKYVEIETKQPGKHPTPRQELRMDEIIEAGGAVFVVGEEYDEDTKMFSGEAELNAWLKHAQP